MGAILKGNIVASTEAKPCRFNLADIRAEASEIIKRACDELDKAKLQAEQIKKQAELDAAKIKELAQKDGFEKGFQEGLQAGKEQGRQEALEQSRAEFVRQSSTLIQNLNTVIDKFQGEREYLLAEAHQELVGLAIAIASKVIKKQLKVDSSIVAENIKSAISMIADKTSVIVRLHPKDIERLNLIAPEQAAKLTGLAHIQIQSDESIEEGGCVIQTKSGNIDAQISKQIEKIVYQLSPDMKENIENWSSDKLEESLV